MPEGFPAEQAREAKDEWGRTVYVEAKSQVPRDFYLTKKGGGQVWGDEGVWGLLELVYGARKTTTHGGAQGEV